MSENGIEDVLYFERNIGYLDPEIDKLLIKLNKLDKIETTSTCTGRITIVEGEMPWERGQGGSRILYKTHDKISYNKIIEKITTESCHIWVRVSGAILHIRTPSLECAQYLVKSARQFGFKHSGIISIGDNSIVVELMSGAQYMAPLKINCNEIINRNKLNLIINHLNKTLYINKKRLYEMIEYFVSNNGPCD